MGGQAASSSEQEVTKQCSGGSGESLACTLHFHLRPLPAQQPREDGMNKGPSPFT